MKRALQRHSRAETRGWQRSSVLVQVGAQATGKRTRAQGWHLALNRRGVQGAFSFSFLRSVPVGLPSEVEHAC